MLEIHAVCRNFTVSGNTLHDGVVTIHINRYLLHKCKWKVVVWVAGILGGAIINSLLR